MESLSGERESVRRAGIHCTVDNRNDMGNDIPIEW